MKDLSTSRWRTPERDHEEPEYARAASMDEFRFSDYWNIVVKHRWKIITIFTFIFIFGAYFPLKATKLYTASATIKIEPRNPQITGVGAFQAADSWQGAQEYFQTQYALLRMRPLAARVITDLGLESNKTFKSTPIISPNPLDHIRTWALRQLNYVTNFILPYFRSSDRGHDQDTFTTITLTNHQSNSDLKVPPHLIGRYLGFLSVEPVPATRLVRVSFTTPNRDLSHILANAHVQSFLRMSLENRFNLTGEARQFLNQKKSEFQKKLASSEAALNRFRRTHGLISIEKGENIIVDRLLELNRQLTVARAQRIEAESLHRTVEDKNFQDLADIMQQGLVPQLKGNVAALQAEKSRLSTTLKPEHPRMQEIDRQIKLAVKALDSEITNVVRGIRSKYVASLANEKALAAEAKKQQQDALQMKELSVDYAVLQEEVNANRSLYESMVKRLNETDVSNDIAASNISIIEMAAKPSSASGPDTGRYLAISIICGLLFGIGAAFFYEYLKFEIGTPDDVRRSVGLSTLGVVPDLKFLGRALYGGKQIGGPKHVGLPFGSSLPIKELVINHAPLSIFNEAYRTIRTSLLLSQAEKPPQVILLTSPSSGEGKTVTSLNLAIALAGDGHRVLLIDGDMRRGSCHNRLGMTNNRGLSNVLTGGLLLEEGIQDTSVSGLYLFSRGVPPPNPSELLGSRKMRDLLNELRKRFDFILIDSPPVIALSDAAILSVISDGVLLVFNGKTTKVRSAQKAVERLDTVHAPLLGVVLNAVNLDNPEYSYYRTYSHYYQTTKEYRDVHELRTNDFHAKEISLHNPNGNQPQTEGREYYSGNLANDTSDIQSGENVVGVKAVGSKSGPDGDATVQSIDTHPISVHGTLPLRDEKTEETVSHYLMDRLINVFVEAVGPLGPLIVRDQISVLGESQDAFPKSRLNELVDSIEPEILHPEARSRFREAISEEIRNLNNH